MDSQSEKTSLSLLEGARARDPVAWQSLVRIYGPLVYQWARKAGVRREDAADIVQEVFTAVATLLPRFRHEKPGDSFRGWLWTICHRRVLNHFHRLRAQPNAEGGSTANLRLQNLAAEPPPEESEEGQLELGQMRRRALLQYQQLFKPQVWQAFWEVTVQERPAEEVAADLGVSVWAVYKSKSRVLQRLRRELEGLLEWPMRG